MIPARAAFGILVLSVLVFALLGFTLRPGWRPLLWFLGSQEPVPEPWP